MGSKLYSVSMKVTLNFIANIEHVWFFHYFRNKSYIHIINYLVFAFAYNAKSFAIARFFSFSFSSVLLDRLAKVFFTLFVTSLSRTTLSDLFLVTPANGFVNTQLLSQMRVARACLICVRNSKKPLGNCLVSHKFITSWRFTNTILSQE